MKGLNGYYELMYELAAKLDSFAEPKRGLLWFGAEMDKFYVRCTSDASGRKPFRAKRGQFPHRLLYDLLMTQEAPELTVWDFAEEILPCAPCALIRAIIAAKMLPPQEELASESELIYGVACSNPDPYESVLKYLIGCGVIETRIPDGIYLECSRTETTTRFLLQQGCPVTEASWSTFSRFYTHNQKAGILRALLEVGGPQFRLDNFQMIDLASFIVLEQFYPCEEIEAWIRRERLLICTSILFCDEVWPYLARHYGVRWNCEEVGLAMSAVRLTIVNFESSAFVFTYKAGCELGGSQFDANYIFARLGCLINCSSNGAPFAIARNLAILDRHLDWRQPVARKYFSRALKRRIFTLLCVCNRLRGSSLWLKQLLHLIVPHAVSASPCEAEEPVSWSEWLMGWWWWWW